jgi:polyhydroxybutyrate depolymerase
MKRAMTFLVFLAPLMLFAQSNKDVGTSTADQMRKLLFGGTERTYWIHIPASRIDMPRAPLLIMLHGGGSTGKANIGLTKGEFNFLSDRDGFLVVYPDGINKHWNDGRTEDVIVYGKGQKLQDDVGFISALIDSLINTMNVDPDRVYVTGMSNGALMAYRLGCEIPDKLAAIAPVDGSISQSIADTVSPRSSLAVLAINNTKDPLVHWNGGDLTGPFGKRTLGKILSVQQSVNFWVKRDQCVTTPIVTNLPSVDPNGGMRVSREEYTNGDQGTEVVLYAIEGGGHTWPGGVQYAPIAMIGRTSRDIDACQIIWDFFKKHVRTSTKDETQSR